MRAGLFAALLALPLAAQAAAPAAEALLERLAARDFAALGAALAAARAAIGDDGQSELEAARAFRAFGLPRARTEDVEAWLEAAPGSYDAQLAAAVHYRSLGWFARGSSYAHETAAARHAESRAHFTNALRLAQASLELAREQVLSRTLILDLARHLPGPPEADEIYAAALAARPRSALLRAQRLDMLQPRWGGSLEAMDELIAEARRAGLAPADLAWLEAQRLAYEAAQLEDRGSPREGIALAERSLAAQETAYGHVLRGRMLRQLGDEAAAQAAFERAVQLDPYDRYALNNLAQGLRLRGQRGPALEAYKRAALAGNDWSANEAGFLLLRGHAGFPRDPREAFDWLALGARMGSADAMYNLGECYRLGDCGAGVARDDAQALHWYRRADAYGGERGALGLAAMLWDGAGVERDDGEAVRLWLRTARSADPEVRKVSRRNLAHLVDLRRGLPALVRASGHPEWALGMLAAMALLPLVALALALRDGALTLTRRAAARGARRVVGPRAVFWLVAWAWPLAAGAALWIAFALGLLPDFRIAPALFVPLAAPSLMVLFAIASGEWRVVADAERLRFGSVGMPHAVPWAEVASATQEGHRIRLVTRARHVHELHSRPFGKSLWEEIASRLGLDARSGQAPRETTRPGLR
jgi:TPR repeat protein